MSAVTIPAAVLAALGGLREEDPPVCTAEGRGGGDLVSCPVCHLSPKPVEQNTE